MDGDYTQPISIHSPRMGRDQGWDGETFAAVHFNPLSPHGERRRWENPPGVTLHFNPLSPHGERHQDDPLPGVPGDFNPLSPHGERQLFIFFSVVFYCISIHSPRMGRDRSAVKFLPLQIRFQSTLPAWGETRPVLSEWIATDNFNPLSPHGERHRAQRQKTTGEEFQSTLPAWGETLYSSGLNWQRKISIHSPRMGRDSDGAARYARTINFNPLSPHGERPSCRELLHQPPGNISIHSPRMGRDSKRTQLFEEKNWRICTTLYLFASKGVLPADKKTF